MRSLPQKGIGDAYEEPPPLQELAPEARTPVGRNASQTEPGDDLSTRGDWENAAGDAISSDQDFDDTHGHTTLTGLHTSRCRVQALSDCRCVSINVSVEVDHMPALSSGLLHSR